MFGGFFGAVSLRSAWTEGGLGKVRVAATRRLGAHAVEMRVAPTRRLGAHAVEMRVAPTRRLWAHAVEMRVAPPRRPGAHAVAMPVPPGCGAPAPPPSLASTAASPAPWFL